MCLSPYGRGGQSAAARERVHQLLSIVTGDFDGGRAIIAIPRIPPYKVDKFLHAPHMGVCLPRNN